MKNIISTIKSSITLMLVVTNILVFVLVAYYQTQNLRIIFFDVGQGDSFIIITPDKKTILVDGGDGKNDLSGKLRQYLPVWQKLDGIILTHTDNDHIGGLPEIVTDWQPQLIFLPPLPTQNEQTTIVKKIINADYLIYPNFAQIYRLGCCVSLNFLWPVITSDLNPAETNENSLTFILQYGQFRFWSGGDLPSAQEDKLINCCVQKTVDLLKVSHHGSDASSSENFISKLNPKVAVIQVGAGNSYGHPTNRVLNTLTNHDSKIYRTDQDGDLEITVMENFFNIVKKGGKL